MNRLYFLLSLLLIAGCGNLDSVPPFDNLNNNTVSVIGHGGNGFQSIFDPFNPLPSNSSQSIQEAIDIPGINGVEIDVHLSADSVLIAFHDYELDKITDLSGCIEEKNASEIIGEEYRNGLGIFHDEKIIAFEKVIDLLLPKNTELHIDAKLNNVCAEKEGYSRYKSFLNTLIRLLDKKKFPLERVIIISEYEPFLDLALKIKNGIRVVKDGPKLTLDGAIEYSKKNYFGVSVDLNRIEREQINLFHENNLRVIIFGGKSRSGLIRTLAKNPDYIQTNNPERLVGLIRDWHKMNPS